MKAPRFTHQIGEPQGIIPPRRFLKLFDNARSRALVTSWDEDPEFVERLSRLRSFSFAAGMPGGTPQVNTFGLDGYDEYYKHLVIFDKASGEVVAGTRLGVGREVLEEQGWEALYTARYWLFREGMIDIAHNGVEAGRTWVNPAFQRRLWGLALLWKALALFLETREASYFFGVVSLTGYPEESERLIMNYLWRYHRSEAELVVPWHPAPIRGYERYTAEHEGVPAEQALRRLASALKSISPEYPVPVLLRHYARSGAEIAGRFALEPHSGESQEDKVAAPLFTAAGRLRASINRFKSL